MYQNYGGFQKVALIIIHTRVVNLLYFCDAFQLLTCFAAIQYHSLQMFFNHLRRGREEEGDFCSSFNPTVLKAGSYFWSCQGHQPKNLVLYDRPSSPLKVQLLGIKCLINYYIQGTKRTVDYK